LRGDTHKYKKIDNRIVDVMCYNDMYYKKSYYDETGNALNALHVLVYLLRLVFAGIVILITDKSDVRE
jgi:hypothetical protein